MDRNLLNSFFSDERGTETVEWGLMAGLIVGGLVLTVAAIGTWVRLKFTELKTDLGA
ncbi:MAG: Flp family type IVb pilin [Planctomycetota bacterium]|nr:Flp family type IVb pilin [Planctomycetota bacterium]